MPRRTSNRTGGRSSRIDGAMARWLPPRLHRLVRFGMAGIAATLFYFALVNALVLAANMAPVSASVAAYLIALVLSYCLQSWFAFRTEVDSVSQLARFAVTSLCGLMVSYGIMTMATNVLHWPYLAGALAVSVLIPMANYIVFSAWVFRSGANPGDRT